jgi:glycosyltransferase involved in cell wall biosynthesis
MPISVVVPSHNHGKFLLSALTSILSQRLRPEQVIVVDDKSTDDSAEIATRFSQAHPQVEVVRHETNRGPPAALNTGLARAKGEFIAFVGADDFVLPGLFETMVREMRRHPAAALACGEVALLGPEDRILGFRPLTPPAWRTRYIPPEAVQQMVHRSDNWIVGTATVYRRQRVEEIGGFDESLGSFCDGMAVRQLAFRHGFCFVPHVYAVWRRSPKSYSASTALSMTENRRVFDRAVELFETSIGPELAAAYHKRFKRRWRFGTAQSILLWERGETDVNRLLVGMGGKERDRRMLERINRFAGTGSLGRVLSLAWITFRTRPIHRGTLFANAVRGLMLGPLRKRQVRRQVEALDTAQRGGRLL